MVIDAAKGIEKQTLKIVRSMQKTNIRIFTFMKTNSIVPREIRMELLDELEHVLGIHAYVMNFPLGTGFEFRGVFDRRQKQVHFLS